MTTTSDFDTRLAARLARLEAAVPASALPTLTAAAVDLLRRPVVARHRGRRRLAVLLAFAAILVTTAAVAAERSLYPDTPEPRLEAALITIFNGSDCLSAADVTPKIEAQLVALGYQGWVVTPRPGADTVKCVGPAVISPLHEVALIPVAGRQLADAIAADAQILEQQCLNRSQAFGLVSSTVRSFGNENFTVSADPWGPTGGPIDKIQFYEQHVRDGCFVFVGTGGDDSGKTEYFLWGPWP
jgi:hypothetical protein